MEFKNCPNKMKRKKEKENPTKALTEKWPSCEIIIIRAGYIYSTFMYHFLFHLIKQNLHRRYFKRE